MLKSKSLPILVGAAGLLVTGLVSAPPVQADTFTFTSCHISSSACEGGAVPSGFGTVTLTQSGTSVNFDVVLTNGNRFVETGSGGGNLFDFNDTVAGSTVTNATATLNGTTTSLAVSGSTNLAPFMADGTGTFTAEVSCTTDCTGGSTPDINDLHFTVTSATLAQLETANANGNIFVADILCGANQTGCTGGLTGPVDVSVPAPLLGHGLLVVLAIGGVLSGSKLLERHKKHHLQAA